MIHLSILLGTTNRTAATVFKLVKTLKQGIECLKDVYQYFLCNPVKCLNQATYYDELQ